MQRHLYQSLRRLGRQHCRRRLYSAHATVAQHNPSEPVASSSSRPVNNAEDTKHEETPAHGSKKKTARSTPVDRLVTLPPDTDDPRSMPNKVDAYLASLRAGGIEPTLEDLARLAPRRIPSTKSSGYAAAHAEMVDRLCRTFSKEQLQRFCKELGLDNRYSRPKRKKIEYAEAIMEKSWGWENLNDLEKRKRDASEVANKSFPVSASELFLLLGKDGSELLQISRDYNVHISVTPDPLSIQIEGFRGSIKKLEAMIVERRKSIIEEKVELPTKEPLSSSLLQQVSRTANAFIENLGHDGKIRIRANNQKRLNTAKRLAHRAAVQTKRSLNTPFAALLPPPSAFALENTPSSYALFPFVPQRDLPWTNAGGSVFRSRRVNDWLGDSGRHYSLFSADLSGRKGKLTNIVGEISTLEDLVSQAFQDAAGSYHVTASTGHILIMPASQHHQSNILPPLPGRWQYSELLDWMKEDAAQRIFVPCLPTSLQSAAPSQEKIIHRLTYHHIQNKGDSPDSGGMGFNPVKIIRAEVVINRQQLEDSEMPAPEPDKSIDRNYAEEAATRSELDEILIDDHVPLERPLDGSNESDEAKTMTAEQASSSVDVAENVSASDVPPLTAPVAENSASEQLEVPLDAETISSDAEKASESLEVENNPDSMDAGQRVSEIGFNNEPTCYSGRELELLVAVPDRPMDLKLTVMRSIEPISVRTNAKLHGYFEALKTYLDNSATESSPPVPPLFIEVGEDRYILDLNASIRQSTESLDLGRQISQDLDSSSLDALPDRRILTTTESIYDLESGNKLVNCEIACNAASFDETWASFLRDVDEISSLGYKTKQASGAGSFLPLDDHAPNEDGSAFQ